MITLTVNRIQYKRYTVVASLKSPCFKTQPQSEPKRALIITMESTSSDQAITLSMITLSDFYILVKNRHSCLRTQH